MEKTDLLEERLEKIISEINNSELSSVKSVVVGIIQLINDPKSTTRDLQKIIQVDPPLTAKILRVSNSAFYAPQIKIDEIEKAIIWIGYDTVKELAIRQKTGQMFGDKDSIEGYREQELWAYCVATAQFAKMIYRREFGLKGENIYTAGLLHKIGLIAVEQFLREEFIKILKLFNLQKGKLSVIEKKVLGFTHAELGGHIARNWLLPNELSAAITYHDNPYAAPTKCFKECATMYVAAVQCRFAGIGYVKATVFDEPLYHRCLKDLKLTQKSIDPIIADGRQELADMLEKGAL